MAAAEKGEAMSRREEHEQEREREDGGGALLREVGPSCDVTYCNVPQCNVMYSFARWGLGWAERGRGAK